MCFFLPTGYGNLAPRTPEGKVVTMLYALVGVPLMLLCLSNLGSFLADTFQFAYSHACCKPCRNGGSSSGSSGSSSSGSGSGGQHKHKLLQQVDSASQRVGYNVFGDGSVSLGPPGSIACPPGPPPSTAMAACNPLRACGPGCGPVPAGNPCGALACGPGCATAGSFG